MRHTYAQSLTSKDTTLIHKLTREIMDKEGLSIVSLRFKPKVWSTAFFVGGIMNRRTRELVTIGDQYIQLGGTMLTGSNFPSAIYYISIFDPEHKLYSIKRPKDIMLADIVASTIIEEIAHAVVFNRIAIPAKRRPKPHGVVFQDVFVVLWKEYFIMLKFKLMSIYGNNGISGEDFFER